MALELKSQAFKNNGEIPVEYTCEGRNVSPPLAWTGAPEGTRSFALIVDDPDAPDPAAPKTTYVHWVLFEISPEIHSLAEDAREGALPQGTRQGLNDWKQTGYGGPCPPIGRHRYFFKLYALDTPLLGFVTPTKAELEDGMEGHVLEKAEIVGTYEKRTDREIPRTS